MKMKNLKQSLDEERNKSKKLEEDLKVAA